MKPEQEPKYDVDRDGRIFNRESGKVILDDEPIFILRARDIRAVQALSYYANICLNNGHVEIVRRRRDDFKAFAFAHPERLKEPDTVLRETVNAMSPLTAERAGAIERFTFSCAEGCDFADDIGQLVLDYNGDYCRYADAYPPTLSGSDASDAARWQPIDTAPKDGTRILALHENRYPIILSWGPTQPDALHYASWRTNVDDVAHYWTPTHWMPLPGLIRTARTATPAS